MYDTTVEVDREYLWALEVLACDSLGIDGEQKADYMMRYMDAKQLAEDGVLNQPRTREMVKETDYEYTGTESE